MSYGSETSDMTSEGLGEMFEGDSADMCAGKFPLVSMGGRAEGLACADPGVRTPIGASGNFYKGNFQARHTLYGGLQRVTRLSDCCLSDYCLTAV